MEVNFNAAIDGVKVKVKDVDGLVVRSMEIKFGCVFDGMIAAALGSAARTALEALTDHGMEQVVLPLDAVDATADLVADKQARVKIPQLVGVKATCKAGDAETGAPPTIEFVFSALWTEAVWIFLGRYCGAYVEIGLVERQLSMKLSAPVEAGAAS